MAPKRREPGIPKFDDMDVEKPKPKRTKVQEVVAALPQNPDWIKNLSQGWHDTLRATFPTWKWTWIVARGPCNAPPVEFHLEARKGDHGAILRTSWGTEFDKALLELMTLTEGKKADGTRQPIQEST